VSFYPDPAYGAHVSRQELAYLLAYEEFERSLTPAERIILGSAAVPDIEDPCTRNARRIVLGASRDAAERSSASFSIDYSEYVDGNAGRLADVAGVSMGDAKKIIARIEELSASALQAHRANLLFYISGFFLSCANPKLQAVGLAYAADMALTAGLGTMQDWALKNGVSRAAVSKVAKAWQRRMGFPPGSHMRDEAKCRAYSNAQMQKHWRGRKVAGGLREGREAAQKNLEEVREKGNWILNLGAMNVDFDGADLVDVPAQKIPLIKDWAAGFVREEARRVVAVIPHRIVGVFLKSENTRLQAVGLAFASGLAVTSSLGSVDEAAVRLAVPKNDLVRVIRTWQREMELPQEI